MNILYIVSDPEQGMYGLINDHFFSSEFLKLKENSLLKEQQLTRPCIPCSGFKKKQCYMVQNLVMPQVPTQNVH